MKQKILKWLRAEDYWEAIPEIRLSVALNRSISAGILMILIVAILELMLQLWL